MAKINILDSSIYNRIAAGEVVERPHSIVKELVENSIDSGADNITIEVTEGGMRRIAVTDNGSGIEFDDLTAAFLPHATSKIKTTDDLNAITTLGFRGEALASIGSVSEINLSSKTKKASTGGEIEVRGGVISKPAPKGCPEGTHIVVNNLFYNTPARAKFLKSAKTEESYITNLVERTILSHPNLSFKYITDGKILYQTTGKGLEEAIYVIYGKEAAGNLIGVEYTNPSLTISGFIGRPTYTKPNRTYQTLVINGRYVVDSLISTAVFNAFANYMMKGRFPFFVLYINMPYEDVDVNVHPNKLAVRFVNSNAVYVAVNNAVSGALLSANNIVDAVTTVENKPIEELPRVTGKSFGENLHSAMQTFNQKLPDTMQTDVKNVPLETVFETVSVTPVATLKDDGGMYYKTLQNYQAIASQSDASLAEGVKDFKVIGTIFTTYIIIEHKDEAYFIDQHAAHERLLFDKFSAEFEKKQVNIQQLFVPYVFKVNNIEDVFLKEHLNDFAELGFEISEFGNLSYKVSSVPLALSQIDLGLYFDDSLKNLNKLGGNVETRHFLATKACKAAVKAGHDLNNTEIATLIKDISKSGTTLLCPHGRPVCVRLKKTDVDKWFKRIV